MMIGFGATGLCLQLVQVKAALTQQLDHFQQVGWVLWGFKLEVKVCSIALELQGQGRIWQCIWD
jgi:hypothetical protein